MNQTRISEDILSNLPELAMLFGPERSSGEYRFVAKEQCWWRYAKINTAIFAENLSMDTERYASESVAPRSNRPKFYAVPAPAPGPGACKRIKKQRGSMLLT